MNQVSKVARLVVATLVMGASLVFNVGSPVEPETHALTPMAWSDGPCDPTDNVGITVVIDFQELGGGVNVRCTGRAVSDGADALDAAGISWQGVLRWGRGFVCKIAGKPANDPCIDTPPASAYWSYWLAPRGGQWCYSNFGVLNRTPPPGSVEGWSFSLNREGGSSPAPRFAPPALAPGLTPNPLGGSDCDPGGGKVPSPPTTAVTSPPATSPPATTPPTVETPGDAGNQPVDPNLDDTTPNDWDQSDTGNEPDGDLVLDEAEEDLETDDETALDESESPATDDEGSTASDEAANQVDLSTDGHEQHGFPLSTVVGIVLLLIVGGAAVYRFRRAAATNTAASTVGPDSSVSTDPEENTSDDS